MDRKKGNATTRKSEKNEINSPSRSSLGTREEFMQCSSANTDGKSDGQEGVKFSPVRTLDSADEKVRGSASGTLLPKQPIVRCAPIAQVFITSIQI